MMEDKILALLLIATIGSTVAQLGTQCEFTEDCNKDEECRLLADASCACNFGYCNVTGGYFFRDESWVPECKKYQDCFKNGKCSGTKENCFCRDGYCEEKKWECHETKDCGKLAKCKGKACTCSDNTCEFECNTEKDCEGKDCNKDLGYKCKCEDSLCRHEPLPKECDDDINDIFACVEKGLCEADKPCSCTAGGYCTKPWWVREETPHLNCRYSQDCIDSILDCDNPDIDCPCDDLEKISDFEEMGTCKTVPIERLPEPPCTFTPDCQSLERCVYIADAWCKCNFGSCNVTGGLFFRDKEPDCKTYKDCPCSGNPDECFCKDGECSNEKWECHESQDCKKYEKCTDDKPCTCSGNTCEFECNTEKDCANADCNDRLGYKCKCEESLCRDEPLPQQCNADINDIDSCVQKGLCEADKPCSCTGGGYCTVPWYINEKTPQLNCRNSQDCIDSILDCGPDTDCPCDDIVNISEYEQFGTCKIVPIERIPEPPCTFTPECRQLERCLRLADASCKCNFGNCNVTGGFYFRSPDPNFQPECETYKNCPCSDDRENCFCRDGNCHNEKWECHEPKDCQKYEKCTREKPCTCSGNTCEWECNTESDCAEQDCNQQSGYKCECRNQLCEYKRL